ncbi:putative amino acid permease [Mycolicibacterium litorale]|uniref:Putative amino acid permease n=2 Tax=Mycolicibacterium litorale TaxID=758802 RepID=A0A6S6P7N5_9MYCO|nr:putative amino acid permease [Mycolicibacterium litorale]
MSDLQSAPSAMGPGEPPGTSSGTSPGRVGLQGHMGTAALVFTVLAVAAPLASVNGLGPIVIGFAGTSAPTAFLIATGVLLAFAAGLATMSRYVPNPGAFYAYVTSGLGRPAGLGGAFLAVFAYWLMTTASYAYLGSATNQLITGFGGPEIPWYWYQIAGWALVGVIGYLNVELSAKVLTVVMVLEVLIVIIFDAAVAIRGGTEGSALPLPRTEVFSSGSIGIAVLFCVLCFIGFESTAIFREEAKDPEKTVPRAMYLSVLLIGVFYAVSVAFTIIAYGDQADSVAADNAAGMFGEALGTYVAPVFMDICAILLVNSVFASQIALQNMLSRYLYSLGNDGVLPRALGKAHATHRSPYRASLVVTAMVAVLALPFMFTTDDPMALYGKMVGVGTYAITVLMLLASVAVLVYFRRNPHHQASPLKTTVAPVIAILGFSAVVYLATTNIDLISGVTGGLAVAVVTLTFATVVAGVVLASVYRAKRPEVYRRIGRQEL